MGLIKGYHQINFIITIHFDANEAINMTIHMYVHVPTKLIKLENKKEKFK